MPTYKIAQPSRSDPLPDGSRAVTGGPTRRSRPHGYVEVNPDAHPYKTRGLYPDPGELRAVYSREPVVNQGVNKLALVGASGSTRFEWPTPTDASPAELEFCDFVRWNLTGTPHIFAGGFANFMAHVQAWSFFNGFAVFEKVFEPASARIPWVHYRKLKWLAPWQVEAWILNDQGEWLGALIVGANGRVPLSRSKLCHFGRLYNGTNPEGDAGGRPILWLSKAKGQAFLRNELTMERFGPGIPYAKHRRQMPDHAQAELDTLLTNIAKGKQRWARFSDDVTEFGVMHPSSSAPNFREQVNVFNEELSRGVDDQLGQEGVAQYGSRAKSEVTKEASDETAHGMAILHAARLVEQLIEPLYRLNRRDTRRMLGCRAGGFADVNWLRALSEFARVEGLFTEGERRRVARKVLEGLGIEPDNPEAAETAALDAASSVIEELRGPALRFPAKSSGFPVGEENAV